MLDRFRALLGNGLFWQRFWLAWIAVWLANIPFALTIWRESLGYLIFLSVAALILSSAAAFQGSLGMRKTDPEDPL